MVSFSGTIYGRRELIDDFRRVECNDDAKEVRETARVLRGMSDDALKRFLAIRRMHDFPGRVVFVLESIRTLCGKGSEDAESVGYPVVKY